MNPLVAVRVADGAPADVVSSDELGRSTLPPLPFLSLPERLNLNCCPVSLPWFSSHLPRRFSTLLIVKHISTSRLTYAEQYRVVVLLDASLELQVRVGPP